jgi:site-specific DNA recombinase
MFEKILSLIFLLLSSHFSWKLTGDNVYKVLIYFEKLYKLMDDVERRKLIEALVSEVQIHEDRKKNGQWLKSITFKLPIIEGDLDISLDDETHVETVVLMSRIKG